MKQSLQSHEMHNVEKPPMSLLRHPSQKKSARISACKRSFIQIPVFVDSGSSPIVHILASSKHAPPYVCEILMSQGHHMGMLQSLVTPFHGVPSSD